MPQQILPNKDSNNQSGNGVSGKHKDEKPKKPGDDKKESDPNKDSNNQGGNGASGKHKDEKPKKPDDDKKESDPNKDKMEEKTPKIPEKKNEESKTNKHVPGGKKEPDKNNQTDAPSRVTNETNMASFSSFDPEFKMYLTKTYTFWNELKEFVAVGIKTKDMELLKKYQKHFKFWKDIDRIIQFVESNPNGKDSLYEEFKDLEKRNALYELNKSYEDIRIWS
ncbi:hypothetical protein HYD95_00850 [Mycoplasmopsis bovis]|nr:hypothetical protein HYD95_00850 [Mycoplasmopsis bovis]